MVVLGKINHPDRTNWLTPPYMEGSQERASLRNAGLPEGAPPWFSNTHTVRGRHFKEQADVDI